ncbi:MAG TPA: peptidoglycan DD-metalloendopeptidase family protein [Candidatus Paceibacterota bacterium]|nr:peptidoglycan DD-metalloendopeptidase family protein [Candidatus Paceibacterota bacterium]
MHHRVRNTNSRRLLICLAIAGTIFASGAVLRSTALAQSQIDELRSQIADRNNRLAEIEKEIATYQSELKKVGGQKATLQAAIDRLELERKKVQADIRYTENKIGATDLELSKLGLEIKSTETGIELNRQAIAETLRSLEETDQDSMVEVLLSNDNLAAFWKKIDDLEEIRSVIADQVSTLESEKAALGEKYDLSSKKRADLVDLKSQYADQNEVLVGNKAEKSKLLAATKNQETEYQKLLKAKQAEADKIQKELRDFESQLKFILDPNTVPTRGTAVFRWPLDSVIITQLFGGTEFAQQNPGVYGRPYHNGVDISAPIGTPIHAALSGVVRATGNTDAVAGCYSWGKWTLIDHANGLSTLYAHQSVIKVVPGQSVSTGDVIGYTGNTGYTTGPHLHFTVYAKAGVSIKQFSDFKAVTSCGAATTPVAAPEAYIDPMAYLPKP